MRNFLREILDRARKKGGRTYQFITKKARIAVNFLIERDWLVLIQDRWNGWSRMGRATDVDVLFLNYTVSDLKLRKYRAKEDEIISELNFLLSNERYNWRVIKTGAFFKSPRLIRFRLTRVRKPRADVGRPELWGATQLVGQALIMKGFYIIDVQIRDTGDRGRMIYQAQKKTKTDIKLLQGFMTHPEAEAVIDEIVVREIEELAKPKPTIPERIEDAVRNVLLVVIIGAIVYLLIIYQGPVKDIYKRVAKKRE